MSSLSDAPTTVATPSTRIVHWVRTLVRLVPQVLVEVRVRDLLERFDFVDGNLRGTTPSRHVRGSRAIMTSSSSFPTPSQCQVTIQVHELHADLLEGSLGQQMSFHATQSLVGVVVGLFY
jgi:hypothetical protein